MIKQSKFVKTAIAAAALGVAAFGAQAATLSVTAGKYAVEVFGGDHPENAVTMPNISVVTATAIPAGSTVTVALQVTGAKFANNAFAGANSGTAADTAVSPAVDGTGGSSITAAFGTTRATATAAAAGTGDADDTTNNADTLYVQLVTKTALGIGGTLLNIYAPTVSAKGMGTLGATVQVNAEILVGAKAAVVGGPLPSTGLLEGATGATTIATSVQGVTMTATAGKSSQLINVSATKPSTVFTTGGSASATDTNNTQLIQLGTLGQVENAAALNAAGTSYTIAGKAGANNTKTAVTVSAPAGYFAALEDTGVVTVRAANANSCAGGILATSTTFADAAAAAAATKVTLPLTAYGATVGGSTPAPLHVCMSVKGGKAIQTGAATITATLGGSTAQNQDSADTLASTGLLSLSNNGATVDVPSYFPAALSQYGYSSYLRIVNKGAVSAPVSIAVIDPATGTAGTSQVIGTIAAGAATTFTGAQVEALIGAQDKAVRPRLRVTAPTGALYVQSFVQSPNGTFNEVSGGSQ